MDKFFNKRLLMVASLTFGTFAGALGAQAEKPGLDAQQLGITESVLHYCGPIDPEAAKKLKDKVARMVQGASNEAIAKVRASDGYRHAYESVTKFTAQVDPRNAKIMCTGQSAEGKSGR